MWHLDFSYCRDKVSRAAGRRAGALFFACHLDYFIVTQNSLPSPGLGTVKTASSLPVGTRPPTGTGKKRGTPTPRLRRGRLPPTQLNRRAVICKVLCFCLLDRLTHPTYNFKKLVSIHVTELPTRKQEFGSLPPRRAPLLLNTCFFASPDFAC